jgi:drug/metabolite transporter (DMT)-like permease
VTRGRAVSIVILVSLAFSVSAPFARLARPTEPLTIALLRVAIAAVLLSFIDLKGFVSRVRRLTPRQRRGIAIAGALLGAHFALFQWGLELTSLAAAVSLVSLEPLAVVLIAWAVFGIRPRPKEQLGVLTATVGAIVVAQGVGQGEHRALGDVLVLGAVVLFGAYMAFARGLRDALPPRDYAAAVYACAAVFLVPLLLIAKSLSPSSAVWIPSGSAFVMIALIGIIPTSIGHTLVQYGARTMSPSLIALASPGETVLSLAIGAISLGTRPSLPEAVGAALILLGSLFAIAAQRDQEEAVA